MFLVHRFITCRNVYKSPTQYQSSRRTLQASGSSLPHNDFLAPSHHARSKSSSTVHIGTSYEHLCAKTLPRLDFHDLTRTGGRADRGIDLLGKWLPLSLQHAGVLPLNVVVQCKAVARKAGPEMIRELEGALAGAPGEWMGEDTIGVLCAKREITAGVRDALRRSKRGIVWVMIEDLNARKGITEQCGEKVGKDDVDTKTSQEGRKGRIRQVFWNDRVQKLVGQETGTCIVHRPGQDGAPMETEVLMSCNGL